MQIQTHHVLTISASASRPGQEAQGRLCFASGLKLVLTSGLASSTLSSNWEARQLYLWVLRSCSIYSQTNCTLYNYNYLPNFTATFFSAPIPNTCLLRAHSLSLAHYALSFSLKELGYSYASNRMKNSGQNI